MDETRRLIERARRNAEEAQRAAAETRRIVQTSQELKQWTARVQQGIGGRQAESRPITRISNRLLGLVPPPEFARLALHLRAVSFSRKQILHHAGLPAEYVYFPVRGLLSAGLCLDDGTVIGLSLIGSEGLAGASAALGDHASPYDVTVQVPGEGLRLDAYTLHKELARGGVLRDLLGAYLHACSVQSAYQIACSALHSVGKRCSCYLLHAQDRTGAAVLPLTHESLAASLGVRRATVTEELGAMQSERIVDIQRGRIRILDRAKLVSRACECYGAVTREFARLFHGSGAQSSPWPPTTYSDATPADGA